MSNLLCLNIQYVVVLFKKHCKESVTGLLSTWPRGTLISKPVWLAVFPASFSWLDSPVYCVANVFSHVSVPGVFVGQQLVV